MAKVTYGDQGAFVGNPYPGALVLEINDNRTKGVYTDNETNGKISFFGEKLKASGEDDNYFTSGDIDKIVLKDGEDNMLVTFKGDYKAAQLSTAFQDGGVFGLTLFFLKGKDEIFGGDSDDQLHGYTGKDAIYGGKGSDYIYGEAGNDKLTGGKGSDYFVFEATVEGGNGDDVITDFDVKGEQIDFLWVYSSYDYTGTNKGRDTLLSFEDGSSILLENVKKADFQAYIESI